MSELSTAESTIKAHDIQIVEINSVTPNERNRNRHPKEQIERLVKLIEAHGFRQPLVISNQSGKLVTGHGRLEAAKAIGMTHVPVIYQDFASEDEEYAHGIADNAVASWAELDLSAINMDLQEIGPFDIELLAIKGFVVEPAEIPKTKEKEEKKCPHCGEVL